MTLKKVCIIRAGDVTYISRIHRAAEGLFDSKLYDVTLISIKPTNKANDLNYPYKTISLPIKLRVFKSKLFLLFRIIEGVVRVFMKGRSIKADIYVAITFEDLLIAFILTRFNNAKLVYNANELEGDRKLFKSDIIQKKINSFIRFFEKFILKRTDCVIAADFERGKVMQQWYGLDKVEIIRNVPVYYRGEKTNLIRDFLKLDEERIILLYQGSLTPGRGLEQSISAASQVLDSKLVLVLLGDIQNSYKNHLVQLAKNYNFKNLYFIPAVPWQELLSWTSSADISLVLIENVSLSYYLAAPNKLYESIMAEVPYIASNFPEIKLVNNIAKAGILVSPENDLEIVSAINKLVTDMDFVLFCKRNAKEAKEVYNWDVEKVKLIEVFEKLT